MSHIPRVLTFTGWGICAFGGRMGNGLIDLDAIAVVNGIPRATLRTWYRREKLKPAACRVTTRCLLYDFEAVCDLANERAKRLKRANEAA